MGSANKVFSFLDDAQIKSNQLVANPELEVANRLVYTMPCTAKRYAYKWYTKDFNYRKY